MKHILCIVACASLSLGLSSPPRPLPPAVSQGDVVQVNAIDRFMKDIGVRKQSSRSSSSERRRARPPRPAKPAAETPVVPPLASVPVPTAKPGPDTTRPAEAAQPQPTAPADQTAQTPETAKPDTQASGAPAADAAKTMPEQPEAAEVPKPLPKPDVTPQDEKAAPAGSEAPGQKAADDGSSGEPAKPATAETAPSDQQKPEEEKKEEAASPPPPPLEKEDPAELKACLADLETLGTKFKPVAAITGEEPGCGIEQPIEVAEIVPGVDTGGAQMRCETATALAHWMKDNVQPALNVAMPGRKVTGIVPGSTYACRLRNSAASGKVSEHARGNAIDVAAFKLDNGEKIEMKPRDEDSTLEGAFQRAATAAACLYFTTVLSPGSDATHEDHLHLDVLDRTNGYRYCR